MRLDEHPRDDLSVLQRYIAKMDDVKRQDIVRRTIVIVDVDLISITEDVRRFSRSYDLVDLVERRYRCGIHVSGDHLREQNVRPFHDAGDTVHRFIEHDWLSNVAHVLTS